MRVVKVDVAMVSILDLVSGTLSYNVLNLMEESKESPLKIWRLADPEYTGAVVLSP